MRGGFSFCGVDIADIGLEYAPENKDTYVYAPTQGSIHEEILDGHVGGYSYGVSKEPKVFTLRCYYEEKHIAKGLMAKVFDLFRVGKKGMLIFQRRPWVYYYCVVNKSPDITDMKNYLNGIVTIEMKAYYPFGRGINVTKNETEEDANKHLFYSTMFDPYHGEMLLNTAVLDKKYMVPQMSYTTIPGTPILLFNPGTERAKVDIVLSGEAGENGVTIANRTTQQSCHYIAFTDDDGEIYTDGINGKTVATKNGNTTLSFLYHDYGFIELDPAFPILRDLYISYSDNTVIATNRLYQDESEKEWYIGKYIYLGNEQGAWYKINKCTDVHTLKLTQRVSTPGSCKTCIVLMNEITITSGGSLNKLSFIYKPTYA